MASQATRRSSHADPLKGTLKKPPPAPSASSSARVLALPAVLALCVGSFAFFTRDRILELTFGGAAGLLLLWCVALFVSTQRANRALAIEVVVRRQHWVQACAQFTLILYWAWYTPLVVALIPFIFAQLIFAYAFDSLLSWSRRDGFVLGFGAFPVIFSINLFLSFKPQWFYWQFAMIAVGFLAKELIRWTREGKQVHIFNPSSFPLALVSLVLLLTSTSDITLGNAIANTQFDVPHMHLAIFLVALPGQLLFGVARTTLAAVVSLYVVGLLYFAATGTYLLYDSYIPPAVLIGMTLLVTDPSTSPRSDLGRLIFGALYGILVAVFFVILERFGAPTFYDKLLPVPLLNLMVRRIDHIASLRPFAAMDPARLMRSLSPARRNVVVTSVWVVIFIALMSFKGLGDTHPGQYLPFWHEACGAGSSRACAYTANLTAVYCGRGSGWACNEVGIIKRRLGQSGAAEFRRACQLGFPAGCSNATRPAQEVVSLTSALPLQRDLPILLAGSKPALHERDPAKLLALACAQGWTGACGASAPSP